MALQRLDIKSARYDRLGRSVLFAARGCAVEISHEALETFGRRRLSAEEALAVAIAKAAALGQLASRLPIDDGKIVITAGIVANDGWFGQAREPAKAGN